MRILSEIIASSIDVLQLPSISLGDRKELPKLPAVYFAIDADDVVQYVGQSANLHSRWNKSGGHHRSRQLKGIGGIRIGYLLLEAIDLEKAEASFIAHLQPVLNRNPRVKVPKGERVTTDAKARANAKWSRENMGSFTLGLRKTVIHQIEEAAAKSGVTRDAWMKSAIKDELKKSEEALKTMTIEEAIRHLENNRDSVAP